MNKQAHSASLSIHYKSFTIKSTTKLDHSIGDFSNLLGQKVDSFFNNISSDSTARSDSNNRLIYLI